MPRYRAKITFVVEIEAENADDASDILEDWNPLHPTNDSWMERYRLYPDNVEFEEIKK